MVSVGGPVPVCELIRVSDDRCLAYYCMGQGPTVVVCEAGLGMSGQYWVPTMRKLASSCRVVAYDRAGIGASDPDTQPRDLARLAADLRHLIGALECEEIVLVGHSWGGPIARTYAAKYACEQPTLRGLVLVDPTDEHLLPSFRPVSLALQRATLVPMAKVGLLKKVYASIVSGLPPQVANATLEATTSAKAARESVAELKHLRSGLLGLSASENVPAVATTIITGAATMAGESKAMRKKIQVAHRAAAAALPGSKLVVAEKSGHNIPIVEPEVVAQVVREHLAKPQL